MERNLHEPEIYDFRQHDRLWQRVGPGLEPYPETTAEAMPRREELPPAQESQLPGAEPNPCCMGSEASVSVEVLQGFLREELGDTFYVTMGMDSCLSIYSDASWARFTEKFESLPYTKTKAMRPLFANAAKCEPDAQGRIVLPQKLRAYAHLEKDVVVIGVSNRAEIWNAEKWAEIEAEELNPENLAAVMEELGF